MHLKSPCYLKRFVKENFDLDNLNDLYDNTRKTVQLRVNMSDIPFICKHHKLAFTTRFSLYQQRVKCANIFGKHKKTVSTSNKIISLANCEGIASKRPDIRIHPGQRFCVTRHTQMYSKEVLIILQKLVHRVQLWVTLNLLCSR